jgi:hypothetical protein
MINIKYLLTAMSITLLVVSCQNGLSEADKGEYLERGKKIADATAENMLAEVGKNMKEGGVAQAVPFCNIHADGLTTELAEQNGVSIKRTSHLLRNEKNAPTTHEQEIIAQFQKLQAEKQELSPVVEQNEDGTVQFYMPIKVAQKCTVCHGVLGETLTQAHDSIIKSIYPKDQAIGFREGDLRGIWSIQFPKK